MNTSIKLASNSKQIPFLLQPLLNQKQAAEEKDTPEIETILQRHLMANHVKDLCDCY
jgi:hypothetical protein